ncbi:MAG: hypothetical protein COU29_00415, partial [Candidatus Magasanikbacteria bacterium CG10_big_fil_rev_8_21_14_0_10_36_32]
AISFGVNVSTTAVTVSQANTIALMGGNVGIGSSTPKYLLSMEATGGGYYNEVTNQWVDGSLLSIKQDITPITDEQRIDLLGILDEVNINRYRFIDDYTANGDDAIWQYGFIADVTDELLAGKNHDGLQTGSAVQLLLTNVQTLYRRFNPLDLALDINTTSLIFNLSNLSFATTTFFNSSVSHSVGVSNAFVFNASNFNTSTLNNYILSLRSNNNSVFTVSANGDVLTAGTYKMSGIDYGQYFIDSAGVAGQIWSSDGLGRGIWITTSTLGLKGLDIGGFTVGSVVFASSSGMLTQDNNNLFWDDINKRLSVGTSTNNTYKVFINSGSDVGAGLGVRGYVKASGFVSGTSTLDIAETYPLDSQCSVRGDCPEPGDVVCASSTYNEGELVSSTLFIAKCTATSTDSVLGVVSTKPGFVLGGAEEVIGLDSNTFKPIAMAGRVPVKVSTANGQIKIGDYLTSSEVPGVAVKMKEPGRVIGTALQAFDLASSTEQISTSTILVYVNPHWSIGSLEESDISDILPDFSVQTILDKFTLAVKNSLRKLGLVIKDGVAKVKELAANRISTDELCVGNTCVNEGQLVEMLQNTNTGSMQPAVASGGSLSEPDPLSVTDISTLLPTSTPVSTSTTTTEIPPVEEPAEELNSDIVEEGSAEPVVESVEESVESVVEPVIETPVVTETSPAEETP